MSTPDLSSDAGVVAAADRLLKAIESGVPCEPVRDLIGEADIVKAYAVQTRVNAARLAEGAVVVAPDSSPSGVAKPSESPGGNAAEAPPNRTVGRRIVRPAACRSIASVNHRGERAGTGVLGA